MTALVSPTRLSTLKFNKLPLDCMARDRLQISLLHEPKFRISNIGPISGVDASNVGSHPWLVDGNLTIYFQTEETRKEYIKMPFNHPSLHLSFEPNIDDDRGG